MDLGLTVGGISMELAGARLAAALGPCAHLDAVPVHRVIDDELAAWLCPDCGTQLPAEWEIWKVVVPGGPAAAAQALIAAGYAPEDAVTLTGLHREPEYDHPAAECLTRVEVTKMSDAEPQYVHGNCERSVTS